MYVKTSNISSSLNFKIKRFINSLLISFLYHNDLITESVNHIIITKENVR